ncbi:MAG: lasso peptide biosynthesis B2 protein, partial [Phenylobacterium sp.]
ALAGRVRWAIVAVARRLPWRALCFEQGLAAHWMLRRRGTPATLHYGVAGSAEAGLKAHVWVRDGQRAIVGCELADRFTELAVFPDPARRPG